MIEVLLLLLAIPVGFLIAWLARDELIMGRKWFRILIIVSLLFSIWFFMTRINAAAWTSTFIAIVAIISYVKSFDKRWTKFK